MLEALQFLNKRVNFDELLEGTTRTGERAIETVRVRKVTESLVIMALQKVEDY